MNIQALERQHEQVRAEARDTYTRLSASAAAEGRALSPAESGSVQSLINEASAIKARLERAKSASNQSAEIDRLTGGFTLTGASPRGGGSIGQQILNSEMWQWVDQHKGKFPSGVWTSPASELQAATLTEDPASGGHLAIPQYLPGILALPQRPLVMADLIAPGVTNANLVTYMKETAYTNAADTVAEGAAKPESTLTFDAVSDPVRKIAHWVPVTEEMLEDVPALQGYLDTRLRLGVQLAEDDQLLNGGGVAPDMTGFLARAGLAASIARVAELNADTILSQFMALWVATGVQPDGIVMNPANWKSILLTKDTTGQYYGGGPFSAPHAPTLWGLPVALTPAIAAGTALIGAFKTASQLFRKGGLRVETSNSHADFFVKNLIAIRAEERVALAVYRPSAFGTVTNLT